MTHLRVLIDIVVFDYIPFPVIYVFRKYECHCTIFSWSGQQYCASARVTGWSKSCASACNTGTTQTQPHQISNTLRTEKKTTDVVIQQHSRKLLIMDILMSETCWAHKKWNKIASEIKLVFYSSTITMMHGPINIRLIIIRPVEVELCVIQREWQANTMKKT